MRLPLFAWFALDVGDNDPVRFFTYLIEAMRTLAPGVGGRSLEILQAPGASLIEDVMPPLLSELETLPRTSVLVLDDYHLIDSGEVHEAVGVLLEYLPQTLEIAISTRTEPPLSLARFRGRGQMAEISTRELRFTAAEAEALLNEDQSLGLEETEIDRLLTRTEGWPAGLYLAALSLRGRADADEFIEDFAGDDRHLVDYLTAEVLAGQPDELRQFLLVTSCLDRFNASLCDAVTQSTHSAQILREVEKSNLFLVPLDDKRQWYRYHHLFAELLRHELRVDQPEREADVHRRAATWMLEEGHQSEAITHLLSAQDYSTAVDLIAESWFPITASGGHSTVRNPEAGLAESWVSAPTHIAAGGLMILEGQIDEAVEELSRGLKLAARGSGPLETAYGQILLARALGKQDDQQGARRILAEARWTIKGCLDPGPLAPRLLEQEERTLDLTPPASFDAELLEALSERELSVLRMMSGDLSQREIGDQLFISFNTVKTHSKHIYRKLGVAQRSDAVARARQLDLL